VFDDLQQLNLFPTSATDIIVNILVALLCGLFIAKLYRHTYKGPGYSVNFVNSIVLLAMITAVVIMVIGNNLARAFGLVGAMSIIRFRTAVKETQDIVYIFFGLSVGLAAGVGYHKIAFIGTLFIGSILYVLSKSNTGVPRQKEYLLQFSTSANGAEIPPYLAVLKTYCKRHKVINMKSVGDQDILELSYYVRFKDEQKSDEFLRELKSIHEVDHINLFFDEERF